MRVTHVMSDSPAMRAGLAAGDVLIAMEGYAVNKEAVDKLLARFAESSSIDIHYFRLGQLFQSALSIERAPIDTAVLNVVDQVLVDAWLVSTSATAVKVS